MLKMNKTRRMLGKAAAAVCLSVLALSAFSYTANAQQKSGGSKSGGSAPVELKRILVFPTDTRGGVSDQVADDIAAVIKSRLIASHLYEPLSFLSSIPTVKVGLTEQTLVQTDVRKPFDSDTKLKKLSSVTGYQYVIVSTVDDYQYDSNANELNIVMSVRLIDYSGAKAVVRTAAQSATSPKNTANVPELKLATDLVRSLTDKLMTSILTPKPPTPTK